MIQGVLTVNLDPAYVGFLQGPGPLVTAADRIDAWHYCSVDDIRNLLIELGAIMPGESWSPRELILRLPVQLSESALERLGLVHRRVLPITRVSQAPVLGLAG
jgi:hypothetical protein